MNAGYTFQVIIIALVGLFSSAVNAQSQLEITSPTANTVLNPGQTIAVSVVHSDDITRVILMGDLLSGVTPPQGGANPLVFTVTVPSNKAAGEYRLGAVDVSTNASAKTNAVSAPLTLRVEPATSTGAIMADPVVFLQFPGDTWHGHAFVETSGNVNTEITSSPDLSWVSSNPAIAQVSPHGVVTGEGSGSTTIQLKYKGASGSVLVKIPKLIKGDLNGDGRVDVDDINILSSALNSPANGTNDARDLNHDGRIDALDARILTTLCSDPRCGTNP